MLGWVVRIYNTICSRGTSTRRIHAASRFYHLLNDLDSVGYERESKEDDSEDAENEVRCVTLRCG